MKLVVNKCFGGFGLSMKAQRRLAELQGLEIYAYEQTKYNHRDGEVEYTKMTGDNIKNIFTYVLTEDLGDKTNSLDGQFFDIMRSEEDRNNEFLVQVVEELKEEASGMCAKLEVIDIPDDVKYEIDDYDGFETVREIHRSW